MTELQKTEYNILKATLEVINKIGLSYYLVCGSALGAAKYQGFIPWDDDIDIALPREDYKVFCDLAPSLLPEYYVLQNNNTDKNYPMMFSKIRDKRTTFIERSMSSADIVHGVYIDIFPLDGYPTDRRQQMKIEKEKKRYLLSYLCCLNLPLTWKTRILVVLEKALRVDKHPDRLLSRLEKFIVYPTKNSDIWCNHGNWQGKLEYAPREQYGEGTWATFEGMRVRIPEKYDEYLKQKYGDWRKDLPPEQQVCHHYAEVIDLKRSYTDYIVHLSNGKIRIKKEEEIDK